MRLIKAGFIADAGLFAPLSIDLDRFPHWLIAGRSGSGKSVLLLYALNSLLNFFPLLLFLADPKGSGDFRGITPNYAEFDACADLIEEAYSCYTRAKNERNGARILLLVDEFPAFMLRLEGQDRKRAAEIKTMVSEMLMQGRSLPGNGSAAVWLAAQRADADYFPKGARLNFFVVIGMGRLDAQSKQMLFPGEELPEYHPMTGTGLILVDGKPLRVLKVPQVDPKRLGRHLRIKAGAGSRIGASGADPGAGNGVST